MTHTQQVAVASKIGLEKSQLLALLDTTAEAAKLF